jgi:leucine dehydrogenase
MSTPSSQPAAASPSQGAAAAQPLAQGQASATSPNHDPAQDGHDPLPDLENVFGAMSRMDHENLVFCHDSASGLMALIAIHSTVLGPALGGTRFWQYSSELDAVQDALRLSRGMTFKAAITGINLGGGKAVILGNSRTDKSEALWRRYGRFIESLGGKYITAEDVGTATKDMEYVAMETAHVTGKPAWMGGGGDPSPVTAYGVYMGMKAGLKEATGSDSCNGKVVAVEGAGHVGSYLVEYLRKEGATVYVSDIAEDKVQRLCAETGAKPIGTEALYDLDMDVYAPCALGATLHEESIERLKCQVVAGAANNQLAVESLHAQALKDKGILYCPDFLINAGGLINCYIEYLGQYQRDHAMELTEAIYERTLDIFRTASADGTTTHQAALDLAQARIDAVATLKSRR